MKNTRIEVIVRVTGDGSTSYYNKTLGEASRVRSGEMDYDDIRRILPDLMASVQQDALNSIDHTEDLEVQAKPIAV